MNNCMFCNKPIDETAPVAIVKHVYVHLACADEYDAPIEVSRWTAISPDLVRIEIARHETDEHYEGAIGVLVDLDIDDHGHGVYTVHIPSQNADVQAREVTVIAKAQQRVKTP